MQTVDPPQQPSHHRDEHVLHLRFWLEQAAEDRNT